MHWRLIELCSGWPSPADLLDQRATNESGGRTSSTSCSTPTCMGPSRFRSPYDPQQRRQPAHGLPPESKPCSPSGTEDDSRAVPHAAPVFGTAVLLQTNRSDFDVVLRSNNSLMAPSMLPSRIRPFERTIYCDVRVSSRPRPRRIPSVDLANASRNGIQLT